MKRISYTLDRYGRPIAQVSVDGLDVSAEQVRRGLAWVFRRYSNDAPLIALEAQAKSAGVGLWADPPPRRTLGLEA
jgi:micrococcal nuclease